jgi:hypothetical protein
MATDLEKWNFLKEVPARDAEQIELRAVADNLWAVACLSPAKEWAYVELAQCVAKDLVRFVSDTERVGREQIDGYTDPYVSPLEPLTRGCDDCDAKARLFVALCLAKGIRAEMVPRPSVAAVKNGADLTHVSARVCVSVPLWDRKSKTITQGERKWLLVETILARAKVGEVAEHVPHERDTGNWLYS